MARLFDAADPGFDAAFAGFLAEPRGAHGDVSDVVGALIADVRARGFAAVAEATATFDRHAVTRESVRVTPQDIADGVASCAPEDVAALRFAADRIRAYARRQVPKDHHFTDETGVALGWRWSPVDAAGLYVPGGRASYPSSLLMNAIPARVAGVARVVVAAPTPDGALNPLVLAAAHIAGVDEMYRIGGAQAVAALAYGADPIPQVDIIAGPGNAYVAAAKRAVFGQVGIDSIAGPSEILVIADARNDPHWIAADLLSQAEHDPAAQAILITDEAAFAAAVRQEADTILRQLATGEAAGQSWRRHGAVILVADLQADAPALADQIAAEHVEIATEDDERLAARIRHAGALFLGRHAPEALGDYVTGSNHVLPTAGAARFSSGLSVLDFMKRTAVQRISPQGLAALGPSAARLAHAEGLPAHALSVEARLGDAEI